MQLDNQALAWLSTKMHSMAFKKMPPQDTNSIQQQLHEKSKILSESGGYGNLIANRIRSGVAYNVFGP